MPVRPGIDAAYGLFACFALVLCAQDLFYILPLKGSDLQALAMIFGIPVFLASLPVGLIAIVLSVIHRRERPLLAMSACVVLAFVVLLAQDASSLDVSDQVAFALYNAAAVPMVILCVRWFTSARKRAARHPEAED